MSDTPRTDAALVPDEGSIVEQLTACSRGLERELRAVCAVIGMKPDGGVPVADAVAERLREGKAP